jgi:hypothetical protein
MMGLVSRSHIFSEKGRYWFGVYTLTRTSVCSYSMRMRHEFTIVRRNDTAAMIETREVMTCNCDDSAAQFPPRKRSSWEQSNAILVYPVSGQWQCGKVQTRWTNAYIRKGRWTPKYVSMRVLNMLQKISFLHISSHRSYLQSKSIIFDDPVQHCTVCDVCGTCSMFACTHLLRVV